MKNLILKFLQSASSLFRIEWKKKIVTHLATIFEVNLMSVAYNNIGILNYQNLDISGEKFVIQKILPNYLNEKPVLFDVGANVGDYTKLLSKFYPKAKIYSFEPSPETYQSLYNNVKNESNVSSINMGLSSDSKETTIFAQKSRSQSSLATLYSELVPEDEIIEIPIKLSTIDSFCQENQILQIDFLKIDTEGHEYEVLNGAERMLKDGKIKLIQFEFNEMNTVSRVFLKDFYNLLSQYDFYRLLPDGLYPLYPYRSQFEIFQFQNILCFHKNLKFEFKT